MIISIITAHLQDGHVTSTGPAIDAICGSPINNFRHTCCVIIRGGKCFFDVCINGSGI